MSARAPLTALVSTLALSLLVACGGGDQVAQPAGGSASGAAGGARPQPPSNVALTGTIVEVTMHTDDKGNYYEPKEVTVKPGDVVRFKLVTGVHNANFLADSNPAAKWLPVMSTLLQIPGQTFDVKMTFGNGRFYYQCDPHILLGMLGYITVAP